MTNFSRYQGQDELVKVAAPRAIYKSWGVAVHKVILQLDHCPRLQHVLTAYICLVWLPFCVVNLIVVWLSVLTERLDYLHIYLILLLI